MTITKNANGRIFMGGVALGNRFRLSNNTLDVLFPSVVGSTGITVTRAGDVITITATGGVAPAAHASTHLPGGADPIQTASASQPGLLSAADWSTFNSKLSGNQTITLSGDVSGSGATSITVAIGAGKVTNTMLAGYIAASKLIGTDIATVGTITSGVWNAGAVTSSGAVQGTTIITTTGLLANSVSTANVQISGDASGGVGGNAVFYGSIHATTPNRILFRTGTTGRLMWDQTNTRWDFFATDVMNVNTISSGAITSSGNISGNNITALSGGLIAGVGGTDGYVTIYNALNSFYTQLNTSTTGSNKVLTLPNITGTLATLACAETFTNKVSINGLVITANTGVITTGTWNAGSVTTTGTVTGAYVVGAEIDVDATV